MRDHVSNASALHLRLYLLAGFYYGRDSRKDWFHFKILSSPIRSKDILRYYLSISEIVKHIFTYAITLYRHATRRKKRQYAWGQKYSCPVPSVLSDVWSIAFADLFIKRYCCTSRLAEFDTILLWAAILSWLPKFILITWARLWCRLAHRGILMARRWTDYLIFTLALDRKLQRLACRSFPYRTATASFDNDICGCEHNRHLSLPIIYAAF